MKELQDFKNIHLNEDIYVLASGKSIDFIDESFFSNKIILGVNQVYKKIKCNYLLRKENALLEDVVKTNPDTIHFISRGNCGSNNIINLLSIIKHFKDNDNIVVFNHNKNINNIPKTIIDDELLVSASTITSAIHLAAYMGAKNIILVGHDGGMINRECNFTGYHTDKTYKIAWPNRGKDDYIQWIKNIENDTILLKKMLHEKYGCNILSINPFINFNLEGNIYSKD